MRLHIAARKTHKWLGLFVGLQAVIWTLSGLYMTVVHIDTIHGDHLTRPPATGQLDASVLADPLAMASVRSGHSVRLGWLQGEPAYIFRTDSGETAVNARTGRPLPLPDERQIRMIAASIYTGSEPIASTHLMTKVPAEIRGRTPPVWRVEFDHWDKPTLYFSPVTGELLARRHELWRIFDFVWMLHIMDYDERENVNNLLLRTFTWAAVLMALSGGWLLVYSFPKKKKKATR